jgi:hypothetical protein
MWYYTAMKYVLAVLGFILVIIVMIVLIVGGGKRGKSPASSAIKLSDYSSKSSSSFQYLTDGAINAEENHRAVRITIGQTSRAVEVIEGYNGAVLRSKTYSNNSESYAKFIDAIKRAGFAASRHNSGSSSSVCPTGQRYQYKLVDDSKDVINTWSATCNPGTFAGDKVLTRTLFRAQIPDYNQITSSIDLGSTL